MSLVIRLKSKGRKGKHIFGVVVMEKRSKRDGKSIQEIGFYNPTIHPPQLNIDQKVLKMWLNRGAKLSEGVAKILK